MTEKNKDLTFLAIWLNLQIEAKTPSQNGPNPWKSPEPI